MSIAGKISDRRHLNIPKKKILIINQYYPPDNSATAKIIKEIAEELNKRYYVTVISGRPSYRPKKFHKKYIFRRQIQNKVRIERVGSSSFLRHRMAGRIFNYLTFICFATIRAITIKADIVISMTDPPLAGLCGVISAKFNGKKFIYCIQDLHPDMAIAAGLITKGLFSKIWENLHRWILLNSDTIISIGEDMRNRIISKGIQPEKISVIRHGAEKTQKFVSKGNNTLDLICEDFSFTIIHAGNLGFYGAWDTLIQAIKKLEDENVGLVFVGDGAEKSRLKFKVSNNRQIRFIPFRPAEEIPIVLAAGDIHLISIRKGLEGMVVPSKIYPILAAGRPILALAPGASDVAQIVKHHRCGVVADPGDPVQLADIIRSLIKDRERLRQMSKRSKEISKYFERRSSLDQFVQVIENVSRISRVKKIKILRIISRLNIGGPAIHVKILTNSLNPDRFETFLVTGKISKSEGDMNYIFRGMDIQPAIIPELQREINPRKDLIAFLKILMTIWREKPDILHTHAAKAGVARLSVVVYNLLPGKNVKIIHTFHGNVFEGYFNRVKSGLFILVERSLAKITDVIIAISDSQKQDLSRKFKIADEARIRRIALGFDLQPFIQIREKRGCFRRRLNIGESAFLIGIIGRLVPIKRHRLFIEAAKELCQKLLERSIHFVVVGDGELRKSLEDYVDELGLHDRFDFTGWVRDVFEVYADLDILALTSHNEGTPVSIIEAMAASVPVVATDAGGVKDLLGKPSADQDGIRICEKGILCPQNDPCKFAAALQYQIESDDKDKESRLDMARQFVESQYSSTRLVSDIEALYLDLMGLKHAKEKPRPLSHTLLNKERQ